MIDIEIYSTHQMYDCRPIILCILYNYQKETLLRNNILSTVFVVFCLKSSLTIIVS